MRLHEFHDYIAERKREEAAQANAPTSVKEEMRSLEPPTPQWPDVPGDDAADEQAFFDFVAFAGRINQCVDHIRSIDHLGHKIDALAELMVEMLTMPEVSQ